VSSIIDISFIIYPKGISPVVVPLLLGNADVAYQYSIIYILPCKKDLNIAFAVHHTVLINVSGSIVKYKVDNNPKGNIDGIHPTINIKIKNLRTLG